MKREIIKTTILIITIFCFIEAASAADHHLTTDTTWSGTVNMTRNIIIDNGVTLTINPGTLVNMAPGMGIVVNGRLLAVGTATDSIRFTASIPASGWDGIIFNWTPATNDTSKIIYCVLSYGKTTNTAYHSSEGGVVYLSHVNKFLINNCRFHHNHADDVAGAIFITNCGGAIRNSIFAYNSSDGAGGICVTASSTVITDNLFYHNSAGFYGGGMIVSQCTLDVTNCTFTGNTAGLSGGAVMMDSQASVTYTNCIFHGDTGSPGNEISIDNTASSSYFYYCLVEGGLSGIDGSGKVGAYQNTMDTDPLFSGSGAHPCSLSSSSPCINQGKPDMTGLDVPPFDLAGNPRIIDACGSRIDIGAYEYVRVSSFSASGSVSTNSFWCADTVNITGNITISNGVTLTIGSNVLVYFRGNYSFTVAGTLLAEGTASQNIIFKPQNTSAGWSGIVLPSVNSANDTSRFSYCQFLNGIAANRGGGNNGGVIYIDNSHKIRISNCIFHQNYASDEGGAIYLHSANLNVAGCSFSDNQGLIAGGAISAHNSTLNLTDNHFSYNYATGAACASPTPSRGGAIYLNTCTLNSTQNNIEHNNTSCQGGGIYATSSTMTMTNDTLSYNSAEDYTNSGSGGGLFCSTSALTATGNLMANNTGTWGGGAFLGGVSGEIKSNTFSQNLAYVSGITQSQGGGIVFANSSNPVFRNNVVKNNSATYSGGIDINGSNPQLIQNLVVGNQATSGGGIGFTNASPLLLNNTICSNVGQERGGGLWFSAASTAVVRNNILYGNSSVTGGGYQVYLHDNSCNPDFYYSDIQGGLSGFGGGFTNYTGDYEQNMDNDPLFVNSGESPYQTEPASPCMNMGDPATTTAQAGDHDLAGNPRIRNGRIDIGAYETVREMQPYAGNAIRFSTENDSIVLDNQGNFIFGNTFTVEFWLKAGSMSTDYHTILKKGSEWEIRLFYDDALSILEFGINDNSVFSYYQTTGTFLLNQWNHIAAVFNVSSSQPYVAIYVNGVTGNTDQAVPITHAAAPVTIGAGIIGLMDELRVWQTARTLEEIRTDMHLMIPPVTAGLMTYHQFNGYIDSTVVDIVGGNNGTLMNMNLPGCLTGSTVPAAGGASHHKIISTTGNVTFTGTDLSMDVKTIASPDTVVVTRLDTLPNLDPPGANNVEPQYWITDVYGGGNMTSDITFHVLQNITHDDEILLNLNRLYSRGQNSDSLWTFVKNATTASTLTNTVTFNDINHSGQFCVPHRAVPDDFAGTALDFNGVNQYVKIDPLYLESPGAITAETWFYPTAPAPGNEMILYNGEHGEFYLMYHQYSFTFAVKLNNLTWYSVTGPAPALREWYHVCGVWQNSGSLRIYVNGILYQTVSIPALNLNDPGSSYLSSIGCYNRNGWFVAGKADELRVWSVARTTQEIREMMHLTIPDGTPGLLGYWQFNENSGTETADHGGNHDGLLVNMSDTCRVPSSIPAGGGNSCTKIISTPGTEEFTGTGLRISFVEKSGIDTIVATKIDTTPNINPTGFSETFSKSYWAIHHYGSGTFSADLTFTVGEDLRQADERNPSRILLDTRGSMADTSWGFLASADSVNANPDQVRFAGITGFSQFITGRARIIYVKNSATGSNNGTSWTNGFTTLQPSLDEAVAGDHIWVAQGNYLPTSTYNIPQPTSRHKHFRMKNNLGIFGGFAGTEPDTVDLADRDLATHITVLSGDLNSNGMDNNDSYHVFYHPSGLGLTNSAVLDGFTIRGGNANGADPFGRGGGMYSISNSSKVRNCIFKENYALNGGGLSNSGSSAPQFYNCLVVNDSATTGGGAVYNSSGSNPAFTNCTFAGNTALTGGGIVHSGPGNTVLNNCIIWGNTATAGTSPGNQFYIDQGTISLNYSCYSDTTGDTYLTNGGTLNATGNNITDDPLLVNAATGDFRIFGDSPCVNTGSNSFNGEPIDVRGETRIQNGTIDRGACEWTSGVDPPAHLFTWTGAVSADWNTAGNWDTNLVPAAGDDVMIPFVLTQFPVVNETPATPAMCKKLTISQGATLTIEAGKALMVNGVLTIRTGN